jgi:gluconolactonase
LVRVDADGSATTFARDRPCFTNGLAVTPDGRWLWVAESFHPRVSRYDLVAGDGRAETVVELPGTVPDGLAFTADGGVLISLYRPDRILHLDASGSLSVVADDPQGTLIAAPTNVCFVGDGLDRVVSANLGRWHLTEHDLGLVGAPLHRPTRWAADAT